MNKAEKIVAETQAAVDRIYSAGENIEQGLHDAHKALRQQAAVEGATDDKPIQKRLPSTELIERNLAAAAKESATVVNEAARDQPYNSQSSDLAQMLRDKRALVVRKIDDVQFHVQRLKAENADYQKSLIGIDLALGVLQK